VIVTNNDQLAEKAYLIRNHGEQVVEAKGTGDIWNTQGFNYRMTEMEAAVGIEQLKKLPQLLSTRIQNAQYLAAGLAKIKGIIPPVVEKESKHVYYVQPFKYRKEVLNNVNRNVFIQAIKAEIPSAVLREETPLIGAGYVKPLYLQPIYQQRAAACSFNCPRYKGTVNYSKGLCPVAEKMHYEELFTHEYMRPGMSKPDLDDVIEAFTKVTENIHELEGLKG
jgi:dTDP-4-amino-4,6-dideoxygalactose transaminase